MRHGWLLAALMTGMVACSHTGRPAQVEAPNWLWWGRERVGARIAYPEPAWNAGIEGDTACEVCIDEKGNTTELRALGGPPILSAAVLRAVATWQFDPIRKGGRAVPACLVRHFFFRKTPRPEDFFRTEGEMTVTRNYEPSVGEYRPAVQVGGVKGLAYVRICVDEDGTLQDVTVMQGIHRDVDVQIATQMRGWKMQPARLNGQPIAACQMERVPVGLLR